jgi:hypothetical protein
MILQGKYAPCQVSAQFPFSTDHNCPFLWEGENGQWGGSRKGEVPLQARFSLFLSLVITQTTVSNIEVKNARSERVA